MHAVIWIQVFLSNANHFFKQIYLTTIDSMTPSQNGPESYGVEIVPHIPWSSRTTASPFEFNVIKGLFWGGENSSAGDAVSVFKAAPTGDLEKNV